MDDAEAIEYISIHAPARGSDDCCKNNTKMSKNFNPRSPQGGATYRPTKKEKQGYISIHAPRKGERRRRALTRCSVVGFQSMLPTRGSDYIIMTFIHTFGHFNPRSPRGGATRQGVIPPDSNYISIHAPHEGERPQRGLCRGYQGHDFNPRSPRGGATSAATATARATGNFNPRSPRGGATRTAKAIN